MENRLLSALLPPAQLRVPLGSHSRHALFLELLNLALPSADPVTLDAAFQAIQRAEVR